MIRDSNVIAVFDFLRYLSFHSSFLLRHYHCVKPKPYYHMRCCLTVKNLKASITLTMIKGMT